MKKALWFARVALAIIFIWFGTLKLADVSPVKEAVAQALPIMVRVPILYTLLGVFEILLGIGVLIPLLTAPVGWVMAGHLTVATASVLISAQSFNGGFPLLSVVGEFVVKNLALIALIFVLMIWQRSQN